MVAMEYFFGQNFALVMEIVDANPTTVLGKEDILVRPRLSWNSYLCVS